MNDNLTSGTMQGAPPETFKVGDLVTVDPALYPVHVAGVVFKVVKVPVGKNGVNYTCERADGITGRGLRGPAYALRRHDPSAPQSPYAPFAEAAAAAPPPPVGAVVTVTGVTKINRRDLYVVTADSRKPGCVRLSRLGGDPGGRYWPSIPTKNVTVVPLAEIAEYLR